MRRLASYLLREIPAKILFGALTLLLLLPPFGCGEGYYYGPYPDLLFLNPLYSEDTIIYQPNLVGKWGASSGEADGFWNFSALKDRRGYRLVINVPADEEGTISVPVTAYLVSLEGQMYLDMKLDEGQLDLDNRYLELFLPTHWFLRVDGIGDSLVLAFMPMDLEESELGDYLRDHPDALDFIRVGFLREPGEPLSSDAGEEEESTAILVTAPTVDLQRFMADHGDGGDLPLFGDPIEMKRFE